ncbi:MAG: hypothetical protein AAF674_05150 [Pseudomonadota bacterium]
MIILTRAMAVILLMYGIAGAQDSSQTDGGDDASPIETPNDEGEQAADTDGDSEGDDEAATCSEEDARELSAQLQSLLDEETIEREKIETYHAEVEAELGGMPSPEQMCEAMTMLIDKVLAAE